MKMLMILVALRNIFLLIKSDIKLRMDEVNTKKARAMLAGSWHRSDGGG